MNWGRIHRRWLAVTVIAVVLGYAGLMSSGTGRASVTATIWFQQMDSCKRAVGAGYFDLQGNGVEQVFTPHGSPGQTASVGVGSGCPAQGGNCVSTTVGCITFVSVPAPGTYTIRMGGASCANNICTPGNATNPGGYAACNGGSGCRSEVANVTVAADGTVQGTVTNVYPNTVVTTWPSPDPNTGLMYYHGTQADPVLYHAFGLSAPNDFSNSCDGDSDFDDNLTGSPSGKCAYTPEGSEAQALVCSDGTHVNYPWQCTLVPAPSSTPTPTPTGTPTPTPTGTPTPTPTPGSGTTETFNDSIPSGTSVSHVITTAATGDIQCSVTWNPAIGPVWLFIYNGPSSTPSLMKASGSSGSLSFTLSNQAAGSYTVRVKDSAPSPITDTLMVTHQ